jgi:hypothetical protein
MTFSSIRLILVLFSAIIFNLSLFASCSSEHNQSFTVNEFNTKNNWFELYANPSNIQSPITGWSVDIRANGKSQSKTFNFDINDGSFFIIIEDLTAFNQIDLKNNPLDVVIKDSDGNIVNYFNLGLGGALSTPLEVEQCGLDIPCNYFMRTNSGERAFMRSPDGGCTLTESNWKSDTKGQSNTGAPPPVIGKDGVFNAVDFVSIGCNAQVHWNNNIKTKIVNDTIDLSVLAKDTATDQPLEADITKLTLVYYNSGNNSVCSGVSTSQIEICSNCGTTDTNGCLNVNVPTVLNSLAGQCVEVLIEGKEANVATSVISESNATDNFAIRPDTFNCDALAPSVLVSEHLYPSTFVANPFNDTVSATLGYTTAAVVLSANKYMRTGDLNTSLNGVTTPNTLSFLDGTASSIDVSFNDVGDIGIDLNDSTWANVDSDDTLESERVIYAECRRIFRPDHFLVQVTRPLLENNSTDFTYLSNLTPSVTMSAWASELNVTITAQGEANGTMSNYSAPNNTLYANDVTLSPNLSLPIKHSSATKLVDLVTEDSATIAGFSFLNGVSVHSYNDVGFNYDRSFNTPVNPFIVDGSETYFSVNVQDNTYPSVIGDDNTSSDANATFYYGRLNPSDITATLLPATNPIPLEVYDDTGSLFTSGMKQSSLFWYTNGIHSGNSAGNTFEAVASSNTLIDNVLAGFAFTYNPVLGGTQDLDITAASENKATIHLKTQEWLWYVPSGFGSAYDDGTGTDCTMHPCFKFSLLPNNSVLKIESGDFNGTVVPDVNRSDYIQKGVKLFR